MLAEMKDSDRVYALIKVLRKDVLQQDDDGVSVLDQEAE